MESVLDWMPEQGLVHVGFLMVALAYLLRDLLHLRLMALAAYAVFIAYEVGTSPEIPWTPLVWYTLFVLINAVQAALLWHERRLEHLTPEERRLFHAAFPAMDVSEVRRLMRAGEWRTLRQGEELTRQGEHCPLVYAVLEGSLHVDVDGHMLVEQEGKPGQFVGEIGYLAQCPATASVYVASDHARVLTWQQRGLARLIKRSPSLRSTIHTAFGRDLARKMANRTLRAMRPDNAEAFRQRWQQGPATG